MKDYEAEANKYQARFKRFEEKRLKRERLNQAIVFGQDLMDATVGHEATPDEIQELVNAVFALCNEPRELPEPEQIPILYRHDIVGGEPPEDFEERHEELSSLSRKKHRRINTDNLPIFLTTNPDREGDGFGSGELDFYPASLENIRVGQRTVLRARHPLMLSPGKYLARESLYLDPEKATALVVRVLSQQQRFLPGGPAAMKPATSEEINEALSLLAEAVRREDEAHGQQT